MSVHRFMDIGRSIIFYGTEIYFIPYIPSFRYFEISKLEEHKTALIQYDGSRKGFIDAVLQFLTIDNFDSLCCYK